ncbi:MAG: hypothetical protein IH851_05600 [Armatimonadetes bacterium]|nr:hypothetical protein [Armatimonadota bacterium]
MPLSVSASVTGLVFGAVLIRSPAIDQSMAVGDSLDRVTDTQLRELCVHWFSPPVDENYKIIRDPTYRRSLESFPRKRLLDRLEKIRDGRVHEVEWCAISFTLAYFGRDPVENGKRMLAPFDMRAKLPKNVYFAGGPGEPITVFGVFEPNLGLYDSTAQLYRKQRSDDLLVAILTMHTDGETAYFQSYITQVLFLIYPSDVLRVAASEHIEEEVGFHLAAENSQPNRVRKTLAVMKKDRRPLIQAAARKVSSSFEIGY